MSFVLFCYRKGLFSQLILSTLRLIQIIACIYFCHKRHTVVVRGICKHLDMLSHVKARPRCNLRRIRNKHHTLFAYRVSKLQTVRPQRKVCAFCRYYVSAVTHVAVYRTADRRKLYADLVTAPRPQLYFYKRCLFVALQDYIGQLRALCVMVANGCHIHVVCKRILF